MHNSDLWRSANRESFSGEREPNSKSLAEYMDLRDEYDYRNRAYSTTRYLDNAPTDETRKLQHALNEIGIRDRFGNKLIEDGLNGPKTQWANDVLIKGNASNAKKGLFSNLPDSWEIIESNYRSETKPNYPCILLDRSKKTRLFQVDLEHETSDLTSRMKYHINVDSYKDAPAYQKNIAAKLNHKEISETTYNILKDFNKLDDAVKKGGKALSAVGYVFDAYEFGTAVYADLNDEDKRIGKTTVNSAAGIGGSWAGSVAGAKLGAMGGAAIGSIFPGPGTVIGGFIGGIIGGVGGAYAGRELGEHIVEKTYVTED